MSPVKPRDPQVGMKRLRVFLYSLWFVAGFTMGGAGWLYFNTPSVFNPPAPISQYIAVTSADKPLSEP